MNHCVMISPPSKIDTRRLTTWNITVCPVGYDGNLILTESQGDDYDYLNPDQLYALRARLAADGDKEVIRLYSAKRFIAAIRGGDVHDAVLYAWVLEKLEQEENS